MRPHSSRFANRLLAACALYSTLAPAPVLAAQWTYRFLGVPGSTSALVYAGFGGTKVGRATFPNSHAGLWNGASDTWVDLNPSGASFSEAYGAGDGEQVGVVDTHASLWNGSAGSRVDLALNMPWQGSVAYDADGGKQVGWAQTSGTTRQAGIWYGTAGSWRNITPSGSNFAEARGIDGNQIAGFARIGSVAHAMLWDNDGASWSDLHPASGAATTTALAVGDGQQVGWAQVTGGGHHACVWDGSSATWRDLTPYAETTSTAFGVWNGMQVGTASIGGGSSRASLWMGTPQSRLDLGALLPAGFTSGANAIWSDGSFIYIGGSGFNNLTGQGGAILWTMPVPTPGTVALMAIAAASSSRRRRRAPCGGWISLDSAS